MIIEKKGKVVKGLGGLYNVRVNEDDGNISIYTLCMGSSKKNMRERSLSAI